MYRLLASTAPRVVALALLLALPFGFKTPEVYAQESSNLLSVASDLDSQIVLTTLKHLSSEEDSKTANTPKILARWTKKAKADYIVTIRPQKQVLGTKTVTSTPDGLNTLIQRYADQYGASAGKMAIIAKCESGFRQEAVSPSGTYVGMYQFNTSTWISNRKAMGLDPNPSLRANAEEAIKTAAFKMGRDGYGAWPVCGSI